MIKTKQMTDLLDRMADISDELDCRGSINLADIITDCIESVTAGDVHSIPMRLKKVGDFLDQDGVFDLAEEVDDLLPDILELQASMPVKKLTKTKSRLPADKAYIMAKKYHEMYIYGEVGENSFEFSKMKELESMLKTGFLLPPPHSCKKLPTNSNNWWEYFSKGENK